MGNACPERFEKELALEVHLRICDPPSTATAERFLSMGTQLTRVVRLPTALPTMTLLLFKNKKNILS
jgi:hypothetical protein